MFIRPCYRRKNGKRHAYWALMESYRTERGPRQRVVAYLGQLDEPDREGVEANGRRQVRGEAKAILRPRSTPLGWKSMSNACASRTVAISAARGWDCNSSSSWA